MLTFCFVLDNYTFLKLKPHSIEHSIFHYAFVDLESPKRGGEMGFVEAGCG